MLRARVSAYVAVGWSLPLQLTARSLCDSFVCWWSIAPAAAAADTLSAAVVVAVAAAAISSSSY